MSVFGDLFSLLATGSVGGSSYQVTSVDGHPSYLVARSPEGRPALLVRTRSGATVVPLRLAGIEARYGVRCSVRETGGERIEILSIIEYQGANADTAEFFAAWMDRLILLLGDQPSTDALSSVVDRLVAMFRSLAQPAATNVVGLFGELCVLLAAADCVAAVHAWHSQPTERYDFVSGRLRMDVKAAAGADRIHHLSADQATPPPETVGVLASLKVRHTTGGTSVGELVTLIDSKLMNDRHAQFRLHEGVALTLGSPDISALPQRFDLAAAQDSLRFFDLRQIPALRPPFDGGISDVRFRVDLEVEPEAPLSQLRSQVELAGRGIFPARRRSLQ